jgi:peptidoglycan/LPS O-acetylase OafA/YrhL
VTQLIDSAQGRRSDREEASREGGAPGASGNRIRVLDGWRGVSVLLVLFSHVVHHSALAGTFDPRAGASMWVAALGIALGSFAALGVNIFFCISGYVICLGLLREEFRFGNVCLRAFYVRRFFRIFPPLWVYLGGVAVLELLGVVRGELGGIVRAALFLYNLAFADFIGARYLTAHTWSLAFEEQFYLFFPGAFVLVAIGYRLRFAVLAIVGLSVGGLLLNWVKVGAWAQFGYSFSMLLAGAAFCFAEEQMGAGLVSFGRRWQVGLFLCCCLIWFFPAGKINTIACATIGMPLLAFTVLGSARWSNGFTELLSAGWLAGVGRISYGLYLWQQLFTARWEGLGWVGYGGGFVVLSAIVWLSYRFVEMPMVSAGRRISDRLRQGKCAEIDADTVS